MTLFLHILSFDTMCQILISMRRIVYYSYIYILHILHPSYIPQYIVCTNVQQSHTSNNIARCMYIPVHRRLSISFHLVCIHDEP